MSIESANDTGVAAAVEALKRGSVIAYPTETVYGLGADPFSEPALDALFKIKAREPDKPVLMIVDRLEQIEGRLAAISPAAKRCMERFWPGPLSLVLPAISGLPKSLTDKTGRICVRCPDHPVARQLCRLFGGPLTSTSANRSGQPPARCPEAALLPGVALVVDAGLLDELPPSTVFDPENGKILRQGPVTLEMLEDVVALSL